MTSHVLSFVFLSLVGSCLSIPQYTGTQGTGSGQGSGVGGSFTPQQSSHCATGQDCVPWQRCVDGYIIISEILGIDQRTQPANYNELQCGQTGNMCCTIPIIEEIRHDIDDCGHQSYSCVPYFQCIDGKIVTDGTGLIDVRITPQGVCTNPQYPEVPAVCCLRPDAPGPTPTPVQNCPAHQECVVYEQCDSAGNIVTDGSGLIDIRTGFTSCYLSSGIGGRCCNHPTVSNHVTLCPNSPSLSLCTATDGCVGYALDAFGIFVPYTPGIGDWTTCDNPNYTEYGVCCQTAGKHIDSCPYLSTCVPKDQCHGNAWAADAYSIYPNPNIAEWTECDHAGGICCVSAAEKCGIINNKIVPRIQSLASNEARFGEFPWQGIIFDQKYTFICGAILISNIHVLTAAHCVHDLLAADIQIRLGEYQVKSFDESLPYSDHAVQSIANHEHFNAGNLHNDIAVLTLATPVPLQYHINTVCLPTPGQVIPAYTECYATGWGKDAFLEGEFQVILKKIGLPYVDYDTCQTLLKQTRLGKFFQLDKSFVCAGGEENKDACYGDGGGPLVCKIPGTTDFTLVGITSWGIGCGTKNVPGVYANVQHFHHWVDNLVNPNSQQTIPGYGK